MNTNKIKDIAKNNYFKYGIILFIGLFMGWLIFGGNSNNHNHDLEETSGNGAKSKPTIWSCSMHPNIKQDKPGKCPICAMDLTPLQTSENSDEIIDTDAILMSKQAVALANIQTTRVSRQNPIKEMQLYGTIQANEKLSQSQTSHVSGRIEKLFVNFTGETVKQGQVIATIYSPELLSAQQELLEAKKLTSVQPALVQAARDKLRLWKLSDNQISNIENSGKISANVDIRANTSGIVISKNVNQGDYISPGSNLYDLANLSNVWAMFDAYEVDLPFLKIGDKIDFTLQAIPGKTFSGKISFIDPILDKTTRTAKVRVETSNPNLLLKPEMYANAMIEAPLRQNNNQVVIPKSAVLWTGKRSIVYIKQPNTDSPIFKLREIDLGPSLGDSYVVTSGIEDGDEIVTNGAFTIDASAQLEGKRSMMNTDNIQSMQSMNNERHANHTNNGSNTSINNKNNKHEIINVKGLCEMCKDNIEKAAKSVSGVSSASWDMNTKKLNLNYDSSKTNTDKISKAISKIGYDTDKYKADKSTYNALPICCKYRQ